MNTPCGCFILGVWFWGGILAQSAEAPPPAAVCGVNHCSFAPKTPPPDTGSVTPQHLGPPTLVNYTAFNGIKYTLKEFTGKNTSVLIPPADLQTFSEAQTWELVDQADWLYESYKELMGVEPGGDGPLRIAFVDNCGAGCGYVGWKGIELQPYFATGGVWFARGDLPDLYPYLAHEMTHNFDRWSEYVMFGSDTAHAWTSFMDVYVVCATQQGQAPTTAGDPGYRPAELLQKRVNDFFEPYAATAGFSWPTCIRDAACPEVNATQVQGGFAARLARLLGPAATRRALAELKTAATTRGLNPATMSPEQKNDLLVESFSRGGQTNLSCLMGPLHWTISAALQSQLTALFGTTQSACLDADGDGYTPLQGDLNDAAPSIHPDATEVLNGIDDDCNGIVDDLLFRETSDFPNSLGGALALSVPFQVAGTIASDADGDYFKITLGAAARLRFSLKSGGAFAGWLFLYNAAGDWLTYSYCSAGSQADLDVTLAAGTWRFSVSQNSASAPGAYRLTAAPVSDWPAYVYPGKPSSPDGQLWRLVSSPLPAGLAGASNVTVRFWTSGFGWVATNELGPSNLTSCTWLAPSNLPPAETTCRAQFFQAALPAARATEALPLTGRVPTQTRLTPQNVTLAWPAAAPGLSLASATDLAGPWSTLTNTPLFTNGEFSVTLPRGTARTRFFRLQSVSN